MLLCLDHGEIPPLAGFATLGAHIALPPGRLAIPTAPQPWRATGPRRAGISAFGMGGTNAHVVVEEYLPAPAARPADGSTREHLLVLSAHTPELLIRRVADVRRLIEADDAVDVGALCFSASVGRVHLPYRIAVLGATGSALGAGLRQALRLGPEAPGTVLRGDTVLAGDPVPVGPDLAERLARHLPWPAERIAAELRTPDGGLLTALAGWYVAGRDVDWRPLYDGGGSAGSPCRPTRSGTAPAGCPPARSPIRPCRRCRSRQSPPTRRTVTGNPGSTGCWTPTGSSAGRPCRRHSSSPGGSPPPPSWSGSPSPPGAPGTTGSPRIGPTRPPAAR